MGLVAPESAAGAARRWSEWEGASKTRSGPLRATFRGTRPARGGEPGPAKRAKEARPVLPLFSGRIFGPTAVERVGGP